MRKAALLVLYALAAPLSAHATDQSAIGQWGGPFHRPDGTYRVRLHVQAAADGSLVGTVYGLPQSDAPSSPAHVEKVGERLSFDTAAGRYSGVWDESRGEWVGAWRQADLTVPLALRWDVDSTVSRLSKPLVIPPVTLVTPFPGGK